MKDDFLFHLDAQDKIAVSSDKLINALLSSTEVNMRSELHLFNQLNILIHIKTHTSLKQKRVALKPVVFIDFLWIVHNQI